MIRTIFALTTLALGFSATTHAIEPAELAKRQCRSVHLSYKDIQHDAAAAYMEVEVKKSSPGTYFCALGFNKGYFGMQELANGKKVMIFSVWEPDHGQDPRKVPDENRAKLIEKGEGVRTGRFGGEGTGGQSFYDYDWQIGENIKFFVRAEPVGDKMTKYKGWFYDNKRNTWQLMTEFQTLTKGGRLGRGLYSFVEDFRRNYQSAKVARVADYKNGWWMDAQGKWSPLLKFKFTADPTPSNNIDAGKVEDGFFLATGGETEMKTTELWKDTSRENGKGSVPESAKELLK